MLKTIINRLNGSERVRMLLSSELHSLRATIGETQRQLDRLELLLRATLEHQTRAGNVAGVSPNQLLAQTLKSLSGPPVRMITDYPVAVSSDDHVHPRGTANDDTHHPRFVDRLESEFGRKVSVLDLGCSGGGLVLDFITRGHRAIGVEGSDYSLRRKRASWGIIPDNLFTADITKPFSIEEIDGSTVKFDAITAWEVLEHLPEELLPGFVDNVLRHLAPGGLFLASVATFEDKDPATGAVWHQTVKPRPWWVEKLAALGLKTVNDHGFEIADFVRGSGNPTTHDWNAATQPELGFHVVARAS